MKNICHNAIKMASFLTILGFATLANIQQAHAVPITYTLTGFGGNGTFNGTPFSGANFILTGIGDTTATTTYSGLPAISLTSMTYNINGVTTGAATTTTSFIITNANSVLPNTLIFTNPTGNQGVEFVASGAGSWNITSNLGPLFSSYSSSLDAPTNQGTIRFTSWADANFKAVVGSTAAPEPATLSLLAIGSMGFVARLRCRKSN